MSEMARSNSDILNPLDFIASFETGLRCWSEKKAVELSPFNKQILSEEVEGILSHRDLRGLRRALELQMKSPQNSRDMAKVKQFLLWKFKKLVIEVLYPRLYRAAFRMELDREIFTPVFFGDLNAFMESFGITIWGIEEDVDFAKEIRMMYGRVDMSAIKRPNVRMKRPRVAKSMYTLQMDMALPKGDEGAPDMGADFLIGDDELAPSFDVVPPYVFAVGPTYRSDETQFMPTPVKIDEIGVGVKESRGKIIHMLLAAGLLLAARHCASDNFGVDADYPTDQIVKGHMVYDGE